MPKTILLADDEAHITHVVGAKLRGAGYAVLTARDGEEALAIAKEHRPEMIITDLQMPYMSGIELATRLAEAEETRDAIKVLSGKGLVQTARRYGTRVRLIEEWSLLDVDVTSWHEPDQPRIGRMFAETTELRCIIEPAAAASPPKA